MVTMTETAAKKVGELRLEEGKPEGGLRIRVVGGGCSGVELMTLQLRFRGSVLWSATSGPGEQTGSVEILGAAGECQRMLARPSHESMQLRIERIDPRKARSG